MDGLGAGLGPVLVGPLGVGLRAPGRVPRRRGGVDDRAGRRSRPAQVPTADTGEQDDAEEEVAGFRWLKNAYVLTAGAGFGLFAFSFVVLGLWPNRTLEEQIARTQPADRTGPDGERGAWAAGLFPGRLHELPLATRPLHRGRRAAVRAGEPGVGERRRRPADVGDPAGRPGPRP